MKAIPDCWRAYAERQAELDELRNTSSASWGLEDGLNRLLEDPLQPTDLARVIAAGARRSRYAQALLAKYISIDRSFVDGIAALEARSSLRAIASNLPTAAVDLLVVAAQGEDTDVLAGSLGVSAPTMRARLSRARRAARKLAA